MQQASPSAPSPPSWWPCASSRTHALDLPTPLERCVNLVPAGTGSDYLYLQLFQLTTAAHHDHFRTITQLRKRWNASCFVVTLRDPLERIESGFRFEMSQQRLGSKTHWHPLLQFGSISRWIAAYKTPSDRQHKRAHGVIEYSANKTNSNSVGSHFLMSQLRYLRGLDCSRGDELHVLCTRTLEADWEALVQRKAAAAAGRRRRDSPLQPVSGGSRHGAGAATHLRLRTATADELERSTLRSAADRTFVREVVFPADTRWYALACG